MVKIDFVVNTNNDSPAIGKSTVTFSVHGNITTEDLKTLYDTEQFFNSRTASRWHINVAQFTPGKTRPVVSPDRGKVEDVLKRIQALAENPHWTSDRRWKIGELAGEGLSALTRMK